MNSIPCDLGESCYGWTLTQAQLGDATSYFQSPESPSVTPDKWPSLWEGTRPYFSAGADTSASCQTWVGSQVHTLKDQEEVGILVRAIRTVSG